MSEEWLGLEEVSAQDQGARELALNLAKLTFGGAALSEVLDRIPVRRVCADEVAQPEQIAPELLRRYGDVIQRISFYAPYAMDPDRWRQVLTALQAA